jgi:hypothetical protein
LIRLTPDELARQLQSNPAVAHAYCKKLASRFLVPEELSPVECLAYAQGPRLGKGESPFIREWVPLSQPTKKLRAGQASSGPVGDSQGSRQYTSNYANFPT